ncbi:MAG: hypothetical protein HYT03_01585 [Candidatus Harrisonbacteria bacterium]|nr:hypothetical protein [Candidatus Harrisonbacteria bacterium]
MQLVFYYDLTKDVENFTKSTKSVNRKNYTEFQNLYTKINGENFDVEKIKHFIEEHIKTNKIDVEKEINSIRNKWLKIENVFIERAEKTFGIKYPAGTITVYLTNNERCTYNTQENYFFVKIGSQFSNNIIMHEIFHFYTYYAFGKKLLEDGIAKDLYNDIKESLTELLNIEFSDLMGGEIDKGYPQHQEMRGKIKKLWLKDRSIKNLIDELL